MLLIVALLAAAHAQPACDRDLASNAAVRAVPAAIIAADNARDIERVMNAYTVDAVLLPLGTAPVVGRDAIRSRYEELFLSFNPAILARIDEVCVSGRVAFVRGRNGGRLIGRGRGPDRALDDEYLLILRKETAGDWRISHLMWHSASPPPSTPR